MKNDPQKNNFFNSSVREIKTILPDEFPSLLKEINDPPKRLFIRGNIDPLFDPKIKKLCVVGARRYSEYGKEVVKKLITELRGYPVCIISGLALGIDSIAHRAALDVGLFTVAFPGSGLSNVALYPPTHHRLAEEILESGGGLVSEFKPEEKAAPWFFPARNRIMAGVSHATLVVECNLKSGTLITSARATDYNRDVGAIPGSIFSSLSTGPHMLISKGATPITSSDDLLEFLGFERRDTKTADGFASKFSGGFSGGFSPEDDPRINTLDEISRKIIIHLAGGNKNRDTLADELALNPQKLNIFISKLELDGFIKEDAGIISLK
jgi:DNA processing protein